MLVSSQQSRRPILSAACLCNDISGSCLFVVGIETIFRFTINNQKRKYTYGICGVYKRKKIHLLQSCDKKINNFENLVI